MTLRDTHPHTYATYVVTSLRLHFSGDTPTSETLLIEMPK